MMMSVPIRAGIPLSLTEAINRALEYNFAVKSALQDSAAAAFTYAGTKAERFPSLTLDARSRFVDQLPTLQLPFGTKEIGSKDSYQADISLSVPLYTGGKLSNRIRLERENVFIQQAQLDARRLAVAYRSRNAYLNLMASQVMVKAAEVSMERLRIIEKDVNALYENGLADSLDLLESALALEKGRQMVDQAQVGLHNASSALAQVIGVSIHDEMEPTEPLPAPVPPDSLRGYGTEQIDRPELKAQDHLISAAERAVAVQTGGYAPSVSGFAGYSYGMPNQDWFNKTWNDYFSGGLMLKWEFNLGGKTGRGVQAAKMRALSARMAKEELEDSFQLQRDLAANALGHAYQVYLISEREYAMAQRQYDLARLRQQEGRLSVNRLLEMEADLNAAEQHHRQSIVDYYLAVNDYLYALGSPKIFGGLL
jgi:outer membrane protein